MSFDTKERFPDYQGKVSFVRNDKPTQCTINAKQHIINANQRPVDVKTHAYSPYSLSF